MGDYQGRRVAAKVLRVYSTSDSSKVRRVGCLYITVAVDAGQLTVTDAEVLQGGDQMESP